MLTKRIVYPGILVLMVFIILLYQNCGQKSDTSGLLQSSCFNGGVNYPECDQFPQCNSSKEGEMQTRTKFKNELVLFEQSCESEEQSRSCLNGKWTEWSGSFTYNNCVVENNSDVDGDAIKNEDDNCPITANTDQADLDRDNRGDVCDDDIDGDGYANQDDNCPSSANIEQTDLDNDGKGNICDSDYLKQIELLLL